MAVRALQFWVVFAIGLFFGPAAGIAVATGVTEIPLSLHLKDPKDVTAVSGQSALMACEAYVVASSSRVFWSWLCDDVPIEHDDNRRQILSNGSLYFPSVKKRMEGKYQCLAQNELGAVLSNPASLQVATIDREFTEQPANVSIAEQQPLVIPCHIHSFPDAIVHWEWNNKPLPHSARYVPLPSGNLVIKSTLSSDSGFYRCTATNTILNSNKKIRRSSLGQLTILPPAQNPESPKFLPLIQETNITVVVGNNLTLYCFASGWPIPTIQWLYNMSIILENSSTLQLPNISAYALGEYVCCAHNSEGRIFQHYYIQVNQPPHFNSTPVSISYPPARTVRLDCQANGIPLPQLHWLKNGRPLKIGGRIKLQQSGLVLSHSFTSDAGFYQCIAINSVGRVWVTAQLIPYFAENSPNPPMDVQCRPYDDTSICLTWKEPLNASIKAYTVYAIGSSGGSELKDFVTNYTSQLATGLENDKNYTFYVRSYSNAASDQSSNVFCRTGLEGSRNLQVEYLSETSVKLTWELISTDMPCGSVAPMYKISWKRIDQKSITVEYTKSFKKVISGLRPSSTYEFQIQSTTKSDDTLPVLFSLSKEKSSSEVAITTADYTKTSDLNNSTSPASFIPQQVEAEPLTPYSINLTWSSSEDDNNSYVVCYTEVKDRRTCEKGRLFKSKETYLVIKNLKPNTFYEFKVRSQNFNGVISPFSHSVQVQTPSDVPSSVQDLKYQVINSSTVCIRWRAPTKKNGKLIKYMVSYTPDKNTPLEKWPFVEVNTSPKIIKHCFPVEEDGISVVVTNLSPNLQYTLLVRAATEAGLGNFSAPVTFSTTSIITDNSQEDSEDSSIYDSQEDTYYKQKLGVAVGLSVSILCILCCISGVLFRRRCIKRQALARARLAASNNYYPSSAGAPYSSTTLQMRNQESCMAETHEMQHLVGDENATQVPTINPAHLDTKGGVDFPNGQLNGVLKHPQLNGQVANGHVHVTENPRYNFQETSSLITVRKLPKQESILPSLRNSHRKERDRFKQSFEELTSSENVLKNKNQWPHHCKNGKLISKLGNVHQLPDYNSNCNSVELCKVNSSDVMEDGLNITQLTCLDDSFTSHRGAPPPMLGPNG